MGDLQLLITLGSSLLGKIWENVGVVVQIVSAVATFALAFLAWKQVEANREMVREMRESRVSQDRPQVIVDADYSQPPLIFIVVRNIGKGAARQITFEFSVPMESSQNVRGEPFVVNKLPYFEKGIDFLSPGAEISTFWDSAITLYPFLRERGLDKGIKITSRYESLTGEPYETPCTINPLLTENRLYKRDKGTNELVEAVEEISQIIKEAVDRVHHRL